MPNDSHGLPALSNFGTPPLRAWTFGTTVLRAPSTDWKTLETWCGSYMEPFAKFFLRVFICSILLVAEPEVENSWFSWSHLEYVQTGCCGCWIDHFEASQCILSPYFRFLILVERLQPLKYRLLYCIFCSKSRNLRFSSGIVTREVGRSGPMVMMRFLKSSPNLKSISECSEVICDVTWLPT